MGCCGWKATDREPKGTAVSAPSEGVLERHRTLAESTLLAATGGAALCRIGDGPELGPVKHAEGRLAAITELQRYLRRSDANDEQTATRELLASWVREQHASRERGVAWSAYRDGGVAELTSLVDELD